MSASPSLTVTLTLERYDEMVSETARNAMYIDHLLSQIEYLKGELAHCQETLQGENTGARRVSGFSNA